MTFSVKGRVIFYRFWPR